jgi:hypothetical protein
MVEASNCETQCACMHSSSPIDHVGFRGAKDAGPATGGALDGIGVVLRAAKGVRALPEGLRSWMKPGQRAANSRHRDRRPTSQELAKLNDYFRSDQRCECRCGTSRASQSMSPWRSLRSDNSHQFHSYPSTRITSSSSITFFTGSSIKLPPPGRVTLIPQIDGGTFGAISIAAAVTLL